MQWLCFMNVRDLSQILNRLRRVYLYVYTRAAYLSYSPFDSSVSALSLYCFFSIFFSSFFLSFLAVAICRDITLPIKSNVLQQVVTHAFMKLQVRLNNLYDTHIRRAELLYTHVFAIDEILFMKESKKEELLYTYSFCFNLRHWGFTLSLYSVTPFALLYTYICISTTIPAVPSIPLNSSVFSVTWIGLVGCQIERSPLFPGGGSPAFHALEDCGRERGRNLWHK